MDSSAEPCHADLSHSVKPLESICFVGGLFHARVPETARKRIEEIQGRFTDSSAFLMDGGNEGVALGFEWGFPLFVFLSRAGLSCCARSYRCFGA